MSLYTHRPNIKNPTLCSLDTDSVVIFFLSPLFITICLQVETMSNIYVI
jgi:hypothetical protein